MKKLFSYLVFSLLIAHCSFLAAKPVDVATARSVAEALLKKPVVDRTPDTYTECYLFLGADGEGFALVAADDCVRPLLGYSLTGTFPTEGQPEHVAAWIDGYQRTIATLRETGAEPASQEWLDGRRGKFSTQRDTTVGPLMTTTWNQAPFYNDQCPGGSVTGCVATAAAQVMKYWNHPSVGRGSHSYTAGGFGTQSANFETTHYDWAHMPDDLNWSSSDTEVFAVAQLMHHVGIAVEMSYGPSSGSHVHSSGNPNKPCAENALRNYFRYNSGLFSALRDNYTSAQWDSMLTAELDASRPIYYSGNDYDGGHAFILDGYDLSGLYHVNWGWGGYCDGYYTFDNLSPTGSGIGGNASNAYSNSNWALFHVYPSTEDSLVTVAVVTSDSLRGTVTGGGTFAAYTATTVFAAAAEGYRFRSWGSGNPCTPLIFFPNEDFIDTAYFIPILGDTVGYCGEGLVDLWGEYNNTNRPEWGIRLPTSSFHAHRQLDAVQIFGVNDATYSYSVYRGENRDRLVASGTFYSPQFQWNTIQLSRPVPLTGDAPIWITVTSGSYINPAVVSLYSGNPDGSWYKRGGTTWEHLEDRGEYYSWMVRAIAGPLEPVEVTVTSANPEEGTVTGGGTYYPGDTAILIATPAEGYSFVGWSTGDTDNPLHLRVSTEVTVVASFTPAVGIEEVENGKWKVESEGLTLTVYNPAREPLTLYDLAGRQLSTFHSPRSTFNLPAAGVYLLKTPTRTEKIVANP